jgi:hypothetical protein
MLDRHDEVALRISRRRAGELAGRSRRAVRDSLLGLDMTLDGSLMGVPSLRGDRAERRSGAQAGALAVALAVALI